MLNFRPRRYKYVMPKRAAPVVLVPSRPVRFPLQCGVIFHAPWALWGNGLCTVWRRTARALSEAGVPVSMSLDPFYGPPHPSVAAEVADLLAPVRETAFVGGFTTSGDKAQSTTIRRLVARSPRLALMTMIERDRIGPRSVEAANQVQQWWLPCQANIDAFARSGVEVHRLRKVPVPFFPNDPHLRLADRIRDPGPTRFYHVGVVDSRKDQRKMVLCFLGAMRPGEATLTIKTTHQVTGDPRLQAWDDTSAQGNGWTRETINRDVRVVCETWTEDQLLGLHRRSDVYLSLSHGEGWDLPAYDGLLSGNRMVYTASGGPQEFASEADLLVPTTSTSPCDPRYGWDLDARWIDYDRGEAERQIRWAHEGVEKRRPWCSWSNFTAANVGRQLRSLIEELQ